MVLEPTTTTLNPHISLCRPGSEAWLGEEIRQAAPGNTLAGESAGMVVWQGKAGQRGGFIFERQRIPQARFLGKTAGPEAVKALHAWLEEAAPARGGESRVQAFCPDGAPAALLGQARELGRQASARLGLDAPGDEPVPAAARVIQVLVTPQGVWAGAAPAGDLPSPFPGGVPGLRLPPGAPSRSMLKLLEAWLLMGHRPQARERVVDLGAAPGGWTRACLERGCRVVAVDNGPLKIPGLEDLPGELRHLRSDGLRYRPEGGDIPVDWLVADMLIAPGVCLGLLRKWLDGGWVRNLVVNIKLPQRQPLGALAPMTEWLDTRPELAWRLQQLYHDRREVTLMARLTGPAGTRPAKRAAGASAGQAAPPGKAAPRRGRRPTPTGKRPPNRRRRS